MHSLSARELLNVWEQGMAQAPVERSLTLLAACDEGPRDALERLPVGRRDAGLLALRERVFGAELECVSVCPGCGEQVEVSFRASDVQAEPAVQLRSEWELETAGCTVWFRLPDSTDLANIAGAKDVAEARRHLLARCVLSAQRGGESMPASDLPEDVVSAVAAEMARLDPQADVQLLFCCPNCGREWQVAFDIVSFFWSEIQVWAQRILREVHALASAYGWGEAEILSMSAWRRQAYLSMVSG